MESIDISVEMGYNESSGDGCRCGIWKRGFIPMYEDKTLVCKDCGQEFTFTAGEQEFYAEKGFTNEPQRCKSCRQARKNARGENTERQMFDAVCAACGKECKVPFEPREDRPVYCSDCFRSQK